MRALCLTTPPLISTIVLAFESSTQGLAVVRMLVACLSAHLRSAAGVTALLLAVAVDADGKSSMQEYVEAMQPGWNLGNTLDAAPNETSWGNPMVTKEFIESLAAQGFKSIRIPVSWNEHVGASPEYAIDAAWMNRVEQVVNWSLDAGLYVMLNVHHDSYWIRDRPLGYLDRYKAIWAQIAPRFREHSNRLMLETINEPDFLSVDEATRITLVNELNTSAFKIIRASGGGNSTRPIVMPTVVTNSNQNSLDALKSTMLTLGDSNLIATIHYYGYWPFSVNILGVTRCDEQVIGDMTTALTKAHDTFVASGIPVVVGEFGVLAWDSNFQAVERGELLKYFENFTAISKTKEITWQLWDNGNLFNRYTHEWRDPEFFGYLMSGLSGRSSTGASDLVFVRDNAPEDASISFNLNGNRFESLTIGSKTLVSDIDYTFEGSILTINASLLEQYSHGGYGERGVIAVNFNSGMPWLLHVRHFAPPVFAAANGTKPTGLVIPVAFNGDLVATMEARYVGGGNAGSNNWTPFKLYTDQFNPDYSSDTLLITKSFFEATRDEPVDLTFHMWSGRKIHYGITYQVGGGGGGTQVLPIFDDALGAGWSDSDSWTTHDLGSSTPVHSGTSAVSITAGGYGAVVFTRTGAPVDTSAFHTLVFWIHGGSAGGQKFGVGIARGSDDTTPWVSIPAPAPNKWMKVEIPLSSLGVEGSANITKVSFQNWTGSNAGTLYIDDISLTTDVATGLVSVRGNPEAAVTSPTGMTGKFGVPMSYSIATTNSPLSVKVSDLPSWMTYDSSSGQISGIPPAAGFFHFSITVSNGVGSSTEEIAIRIFPSALNISFLGSASENPHFEYAYNGLPRSLETATDPGGVEVDVTYNGGAKLPTLPGTYSVKATSRNANYSGSAEATLVITSSNPGRLTNLSVRAVAGTGADTLIVGFVASGGAEVAPFLVRGIGPGLTPFGIESGFLEDPNLTLFNGVTQTAVEDDWDPLLEPMFDQAGAFRLPYGSLDAALLASLPGGVYAAHIHGEGERKGIALGEVYDMNQTFIPADPVLVNASARCRVGIGAEVLIPGFTIGGATPLRVLIRAIGPTLGAFGVPGAMADARLTLFRGTTMIGGNDNWDPSLSPDFAKAGAFPLPIGSKDAAIVVELSPGGYTVHVQSADGTAGVALVELYALPGL